MKCLICQSFFSTKVKFYSIFKLDIEHVCTKCKQKFPLKLDYNILPLDNQKLLISYKIYNRDIINYLEFFNYEYAILASSICKKCNVIFIDVFSENDLYIYNIVAKLFDENLVLFSFC